MKDFKFEVDDVVRTKGTEKRELVVIERHPCRDCSQNNGGNYVGCGFDFYILEWPDSSTVRLIERDLELVYRPLKDQGRSYGRPERNRTEEMNEAYYLFHGKPGPYGRNRF